MATHLLKIKMDLDGKGFKAELGSVGTQLGAVSLGFNQVNMAIQTVTSGVNALVSPFREAEVQMANVASLGVKNIDEMDARIQKMGQEVSAPLSDLRDGLYDVVSAGVDAANQIQVLELSAKSGKAGLAQTTDALSLGSAVIKGYGKDWGEFENVMDQAFATVKLGQTTFSDLASGLQPTVPLAGALNVETKELFGAFATLTGVTGNTSEVATQLKAVFTGLAKPTKDLTALIKEQTGQSVEQAVASRGLMGIMKILRQATGGSAGAMTSYFESVEAVNAAIALSTTQYDTMIEKTDAMAQATGSMTEAYDIQNATLDAQIQLLENQATVLLEQLGEASLPVIIDSIETLSQTLTYLTENFEPLVEEYGPDAAEVMGDIGRIIKNLASIIGDELLWVLKKSAEGWALIGRLVSPLIDKIADLTDKIRKDFKSAIEETEDPLQNLKTGLKELDPEKVKDAIESLAESQKVTDPKWFLSLATALKLSGDEYDLLKKAAEDYFKVVDENTSGNKPDAPKPTEKEKPEPTLPDVPLDEAELILPARIVANVEITDDSVEGFKKAIDKMINENQARLDAGLISETDYNQRKYEIYLSAADELKYMGEDYNDLYLEMLAGTLDMEKNTAAQRVAVENKVAQDKAKTNQQIARAAGQLMVTLFGQSKAAQYASAIVNTAEAVTQALPNLGLAALVGANGAIQIAQIASTQIEGRATGGPVDAGQAYWVGGLGATPEYELFIPNMDGYVMNQRQLQAAGQQAARNGGSGLTAKDLQAFQDSITEAMENVKIDIYSELDAIQFYRNTKPRNDQIETDRTF